MVTADEFNRWHNKKRLCRAPNCPNTPKWPKREYCSEECYKIFIDYYLQFHTWETAKNNTLKRDGYKCVKCGHGPYIGRWGPEGNIDLEVDHIIARSIIYHVHYMLNYLPVKPKIAKTHKFWLQWMKELDNKTNAPYNLRTLCQRCHAAKTKEDIKKLKLLRKVTGIKEYWFYPTRKYKPLYDSSKTYDPWSIFDNNPISSYYYKLEKCDLNWDEKDRYFHDLLWTFSKPPTELYGGYFFHKQYDQYLSFVIMFESLENNCELPSFKYLKPQEPQKTIISFFST